MHLNYQNVFFILAGMHDSFISNTPGKNTSRQYNLDLLKALAIISMIICHAVIQLGKHNPGYEQDIRFLIGDVFFGDYLAVAHAFMFAMGVGITYSDKNRSGNLIRRGIKLYILGFVLNFFRYGIYALTDGIIEGQFMDETVYALIVQDIFHFAGLALIVTGLLRHMRLKEIHIFAVSVILSVVGSLFAFKIQGIPVANYFLGHFVITTEEDSCFALFNWYLFVAAGLLFGVILRGTVNLDSFYRKLLSIFCPVLVVYFTFSVVFGPLFMTKNGWYYAVSTPEAVGLLSIDLVILSLFHFLVKNTGASRLSAFLEMSYNLTKIYIIQWCIIGFVDSIFCYLLGIVFPYSVIYLFGVVLVFISAWIAKLWKKRERRVKAV